MPSVSLKPDQAGLSFKKKRKVKEKKPVSCNNIYLASCSFINGETVTIRYTREKGGKKETKTIALYYLFLLETANTKRAP